MFFFKKLFSCKEKIFNKKEAKCLQKKRALRKPSGKENILRKSHEKERKKKVLIKD